MNQLTQFYKNLLESLDCTINLANGIVSYTPTGVEPNPIKVKINKKEKQLVLPLKSVMKDGDWINSVAFHPTSENIYQGQSEVFNTLIYLTGLKLHDAIQKIVASIIALGLNKEIHDKLNMRQLELLANFEAINKPVEDLAISVIKRSTGVTGKYPLIGFKIERGGEIDEEVYNRVCHFIVHILKDKQSFLGLSSGSDKTKRVLYSIYEYVIPSGIVIGSNAKEMPYLISFLKCFYEIAKHLNKIKEILGKYTLMEEIKLTWYDDVKQLTALHKKYLPQNLEGNIGISLKKQVEEGEPEETVETKEVSNDTTKNLVTNKTTLGLQKINIPNSNSNDDYSNRNIPVSNNFPNYPNNQIPVTNQYNYPNNQVPPQPISANEAMRLELINRRQFSNQVQTNNQVYHAINSQQPPVQNYQNYNIPQQRFGTRNYI